MLPAVLAYGALVDALGRLHTALSGSLDASTIARRYEAELEAPEAAELLKSFFLERRD